jgi:hypothetical protein
MKEQFCSYEQSLALKELGFNEPCFAKYIKRDFQFNSLGGGNNYNSGSFGVNIISAPLKQQARKFFIEKYFIDSFCRQIDIDGRSYYSIKKIDKIIIGGFVNNHNDDIIKGYSGFVDGYEKAEEKCIDELIRIVK